MHIPQKVLLDKEGLIKYGPITIVAFGDSVTHGEQVRFWVGLPAMHSLLITYKWVMQVEEC